MRFRAAALALLTMTVAAVGRPATAWSQGEAGSEFFEKQVRPLLVARCYECHSTKAQKVKGGLLLDSRAGLLKGGDTGPAVVPGNAKESLLIDAVNYGDLYQMPPKSKLAAEEIAVLTKWVEMGAPWPENAIAAATTTPADPTRSFDLAKRKGEHWSWRPLQAFPPPSVKNSDWGRQPLDRFILAKLEEKRLTPAPPADKRTLIRRAYFDLAGLPPPPDEVEAFVKDDSPQAFATVVNRLLDSPQFGERWARHWLDLVRYAESRGHEFDYNIPNAFEYRDYVIRAFNADVPYDQFVTEHIAGDLLPAPRMNSDEGFNESIIGTGFWFLGEGVHSPVDIRKDECDRVDNMVDVFSKTFLGLTVACARCHDHKFDAISQADYYALTGYIKSSSYRLARFETWQNDRQKAAELVVLDEKYRPQIAAAVAKVLNPRIDALAASLAKDLPKLQDELGVAEVALNGLTVIADYSRLPSEDWLTDGPTFGPGPVPAGQLVVSFDLGKLILEVAPYGAARRDVAWSELGISPQSENDQARLASWVRAGRTLKTPTFTTNTGEVHVLIEGVGHIYAAVDSHSLINGPLHGELVRDTGGNADLPARWITLNLKRYIGHRLHLEFSPKEGEDFRVLMVTEGNQRPGHPTNRPNALLKRLMADNKVEAGGEQLTAACRELVRSTVEMIGKESIVGDAQSRDRAQVATWILRASKIAEQQLKETTDLLTAYRAEREKTAAAMKRESRVCLAMWDGTAVDENLLIRGNHKTVGPVVPRRMLEAIESGFGVRDSAFGNAASGSGRLVLARKMVDPRNPFTSRVMVNRVWQHLLGRGIVPSVDNFGVLGQPPTHPELLDYLALEFINDGWSVKRLIRRIMLSSTYQMASASAESTARAASATDPQNMLYHRANLKRLEGEAIRDAILSISGRLDKTLHGPSIPVHLTAFMQGRGRPKASGPIDGDGRRSIYISVRRNFLSPLMLAFDTPSPASTVGSRNVSNVPAQALILMNDPFVVEQSHAWAKRVLSLKDLAPEERIERMYLEAFAREPTPAEAGAAIGFVRSQSQEYGIAADATSMDERVWADLAHVLFNVKEFVFVN